MASAIDQAHLVLDRRVGAVRLGQAERGVEAVDRLHQVERGADARRGRARRRSGRGAGTSVPASAASTRASRRIVSSLLARLCGGGRRRTYAVVAAAEAHEHVLGAAGDQLDVGRSGRRRARARPSRRRPVEIDDGGVEDVRHRAIIPGPVWQPPTVTYEQLGFYTLAGAAMSPRDLIRRSPTASGSASGGRSSPSGSTSRRRPRCPGAVGAVSTTLQIATAATNHNTRHPIVTAVVRHDDAPPHRRPVHARPRARHRPDDRGRSACRRSPRPSSRTSPG